MHFLALLALAAPVVVSAQTVHQIVVGSSSGQTIFTPEAIAAKPGDIVNFQFQQKNHSVVQSSFANPCGPSDGGFNSGFMPVPPTQTSDFPEFNITVQDETPIWVYCGQKNPVSHCGLGMVFAVNCGADGAPNSFTNFKNAALAIGAAAASSASAASASATVAAASPATDANPASVTIPPAPDASTVTAAITLESSTWTTTYASYPGSPAPTPASLAGRTIQVTVGGNGTLTFDPPEVQAAPRDTIVFQFVSKNHTATQSTFAAPCNKLNNVTTGQVGFDSGFMPVAANSSDFPTFSVTVNDTAPIWVYCKQRIPVSHCGTGMVFAINAVDSSPRSFDAFVSLAKQINGTSTNATTSTNGTTSSGSSGSSGSPTGSQGTSSGAIMATASTFGLLVLTGSLMVSML